MGVLRESGSTRLTLSSVAQPTTARDDLLDAVRETAASEYEVFGEIGRSPDGTVAYLARDRHDGKLVALRLSRSARPGNEYLLEVAKQLDASVPAPSGACPRCGAPLRSWGRFCTQCGYDQWTGSPAGGGLGGQSPEELLAAVKQATAGRFEILGQMSRAHGGGVVYFAREIASGKVEALRLRLEGDQGYSIGLTNVLQRALDPTDQDPRKPGRPK
jgi:hypothetical protein